MLRSNPDRLHPTVFLAPTVVGPFRNPASRQAAGGVFPFALATSICLSRFRICSEVCFLPVPIQGLCLAKIPSACIFRTFQLARVGQSNRLLTGKESRLLVNFLRRTKFSCGLVSTDCRREISLACSRNCSCHSTQEPPGSTAFGAYAVSCSIKITYFQPISTRFNKPSDLFWDRWSHLFNYLKINSLQICLHRAPRHPVGVCNFPDREFLKQCTSLCKEAIVDRLLAFLPSRLSRRQVDGRIVIGVAFAVIVPLKNSMVVE
jgi:hypothetical protein